MNDTPGIETWKIWPPYEVFYLESILTITSTAIEHYEHLDAITVDQKVFDETKDQLIDLAENILNQAARLSRYFWPVKKGKIHQLRGEKLREYYEISENHVLRNKDVRNFLEHFDENLDEYLNKPVAGSFYPKLVLINSNELNEVSYVFKAYVVNEFKLITLNKGVDVRPIVEELFRIHNLTVEFLSEGGRLRKN